MNKQLNIDTDTLNLLPAAVILVDNEKIFFLNTKAISLFKIPKKETKNFNLLSINSFLDKEHHPALLKKTKQLLSGKEFIEIELPFLNFKKETVFLEAKGTIVYFEDKKVIQLTFSDECKKDEINKEFLSTNHAFKLITENSNDIIFFFTFLPQPKYFFISPNIKKILGYSNTEFYNNPEYCFSLVVDKEKYLNFGEAIATQQKNNSLKPTTSTFQYKTKAGKLVWLEHNYSPIVDANKKITSILSISRDITKERNHQLDLEQKWNNYKNLLDTSPIGIFIHEGICIYANKTAANILEENNPQKLIGKNLVKFIVPEQQQRAIDRMGKAIKGEDLPDLSYKIKTVNGKIIEVELKTGPFLYNGKPCVQTIISNISAEKQLSKEILRAEIAEETNKKLKEEIAFRQKIQHELVTQTTKYEAIFNNTSHLIWTVNADLKITSFNQNYFNYVKSIYKHELVAGQYIGDIGNKNKKNNLKLNFWIKKYTDFFNNKKDNKVEFFELVNTSSGGKTYYRELFLHPIINREGKINEIAIIGFDSTERKLSEQKIIEQSAKLEAIFESGTQLIWTIDKNYFFTSFNRNFSKAMFILYKVRPTLDKKIFQPHKTKQGKQYHNWWLGKYNEVFETGKSIEFTTEQQGADNKKVFRQIFLHPILKDGLVNEISGTSNDVTELRHLQNQSINQAAKLTSIFESSSHLIWTVDKDFRLTSFNKNFSQLFKQNNGATPKLYTQLHLLLPKRKQLEYKTYWYSIYKKVLDGNSLKLERQQLNVKGEIDYKEIYLNPIRNNNNEIIEIACLAHDITENKRFELQILDQSAKLKAIFDSGDHLIWTVNKKFELTSYNQNYFNLIKNNLLKRKLKEGKVISILDTIQNKDRQVFWIDKYKSVFTGKPNVFVHKTTINDKDIYREIYLYPILLNNEVVEVSVIAQNITERIENQNIILEQSAKLKAIFESGNQLMWTISKELKLTSFNQNYANSLFDLYGYFPEVGKSMRSAKTLGFHTLWDEKYDLAFQGKQVEFISERTKTDGEKIIRQIVLYPIKDSNNNILEVSGLGFDITENKKNEEKIKQSLKEKEILLKEVHHRVKNNMQVISSILNLQSSYVKDAYALNLLKECQNRIKSMAFIHESLYQTKNFELVNFSEYVTVLTKNLVHTYSINLKKIKLILTLDKLLLNLDLSIPCGLIINEIISNSLKYAFPDNREGIIFVNLRVNKKMVKIEVGDNGVGMPDNIDIKQTQTLGLQLVDTLVEQISGTLTLNRKQGTIFSIEFNI